MNAKALEQYLVFDPEDRFHASFCNGEEETREIIAQFDCPEGLQVLRITMGYPTRDVTDEFISSEDEDVEFGIPGPVDLRRWYNAQVL